MSNIECFDIGGTQIRHAVFREATPIVPIQNFATSPPEQLIQQIIDISTSRTSDIEVHTICLALPGPVKDGVLLSAPPLGISRSIDIAGYLKKYFTQKKINLVNDIQAAVHAQKNDSTEEDFFLLTISTGIGGALVKHGKVLDLEIEIGHSIVDFTEGANHCINHKGCWAIQAAGMGIEKYIERSGKSESVTDFFLNDTNRSLITKIRDYNARGLGLILNAYHPQKIYLMGSIAQNQCDLIIPTPEEIQPYTLFSRIPPIELSGLGDEIGVLGAYFYAKEQL